VPVTWYRTHEEAEHDLAPSIDAESGLRTAIALGRLDEATRRGIRISPRGVQRFLTLSEGEIERERFAIARLREADRASASPPASDAEP
jgi:hypothetical protein